MSHTASPRTGFSHLILAFALLALPMAVCVARLLSPETVLEQAYGPALTRSERLWPQGSDQQPMLRPASLPAVTGLRKPFAIGDRMVIDSRTGMSEAIEVIAIEQLDGASLGLDGVTLQVVTARPEAAPTAKTVRFLFAIDTPPTAAKPAHAL